MCWKTRLKAKIQLSNNNNILQQRDAAATAKCTLYTSGICRKSTEVKG